VSVGFEHRLEKVEFLLKQRHFYGDSLKRLAIDVVIHHLLLKTKKTQQTLVFPKKKHQNKQTKKIVFVNITLSHTQKILHGVPDVLVEINLLKKKTTT
jgi:hypothetical protein